MGKTGTGPLLTTVAAAAAWIAEAVAIDAAAGSNAADPIPLRVGLELAASGGNGWGDLLSEIAGKGKYVALDLAACTAGMHSSGGGLYAGGTFDPGAADTGESFIVSLVFPTAATSIKAGALSDPTFKHFTVLKSVSGENIVTVGYEAFGSCSSLTTVSFPSATDIDDRAFIACIALSSVTLNSALTIGNQAFTSCINLSSLSLPSAGTIGSNAFSSCTALTTLSLRAAPPTLVGSAVSGVFWSTGNGLGAGTALTIKVPPSTLSTYMSTWGVTADTVAGANAVRYGDGHKRIFITDSGAAQPSLLTTVAEVSAHLSTASGGGSVFDPPVYLPALGLNLADTGGNGWTELLNAIFTANKFVVLDLSACTVGGVEFNPDGADTDPDRMAAKGKIVSLVLPTAATSIKAGTGPSDAAFNNFTALAVVTGTAILSVGDYAFAGRNILTTVNVPSAGTIGDSAFQGCTSILLVSLFSATTIGDNAFNGCTSFYGVNLPKATSIGDSAFYNCDDLATADFPLATSIGVSAFSYCTSLATVDIPAAASIGQFAFMGCTGLTTVNLPAATDIGHSAFYQTGTAALTLTLPQAAPMMEVISLIGSPYSKDVTIRTPASRTGYDGAWPDNFKKAFGQNATVNLYYATY
jgi:hypothetical protein